MSKPNGSVLRDTKFDQLYEETIHTYSPVKACARWKDLERYVYDNYLLFIGY